jgi:tryptophan halogenase
MSIPDTLQRKLDLYQSNGRIVRTSDDLFTETSWLQVMHGQGLRTRGYHPLVDQRTPEEIAGFLANVQDVVLRCVDHMPTHEEFIAANCAAR